MAPAEWLCELCSEILLDPVTLPCCGESFCQQCLRQWTITKLDDGALAARCPSGPSCNAKIDHRLPSVSKVLQRMLESSHAEELKQRREEEEEEESILAGYQVWQEVAAARDIHVNETLIVAFGTSGIVLCNHETSHIKVKFDTCLWGSGTVNVHPEDLTPQLPTNPMALKIGDRVIAAMNLTIGADVVVVPFGTHGTILGPEPEARIKVSFEQTDMEARNLSVQSFEIQPARELLGGFRVVQRVKAKRDICSGDSVLVTCGIHGTVLAEYSDTRLVVRFDERVDGRTEAVNLGPMEIEAV